MSSLESDLTQIVSSPGSGAAHIATITALIPALEISNTQMQRILIADERFDQPTRQRARGHILAAAGSLAQVIVKRQLNALVVDTMSELDRETMRSKMRVVGRLEEEMMALVIALHRWLMGNEEQL